MEMIQKAAIMEGQFDFYNWLHEKFEITPSIHTSYWAAYHGRLDVLLNLKK